MSAPIMRQRKRDKKSRREEITALRRRFLLDKNRPPPQDPSGGPRTGAWEKGAPATESLRQGEYKSPWTGQVYDRWAPLGLKQMGTDRQGGLGRARAYETPQQRELREALEASPDTVPEWKKYHPDVVPPELVPKKLGSVKERAELRHARRAGNTWDVFKQIVIQTIVDLKVSKKETPVWFVETCTGEGEYHVSRLRPKDPEQQQRPDRDLKWPKAEDVWEAFKDKDLTYAPSELRDWVETVQLLNADPDNFELKGDIDPDKEIQWLPSTTMVALRKLRKQDPVSLFEDHKISFAALFNFVRNWSSEFEPQIELVHKDGLRQVWGAFCARKKSFVSKAHGDLNGQRGLVFIDPDFSRGNEAKRCQELMIKLWKHWRAATVVLCYPLGPAFEQKARKFNKAVRQADKSMTLMTIELYVDERPKDSDPSQNQWRGYGLLISQPPFTTAERVKAAMTVIMEELAKQPGALPMHIVVEDLVAVKEEGRFGRLVSPKAGEKTD